MEDLIQRYTEAWEARDPDAIVALHTEDTTFRLHAGQEQARGKAAVRQAFADLFTQFPDLTFEKVSLHVGEDFWAVEWRVSGTAAGNGARVEADLADVVTVRDGLVKSKDSYVDAVTMQEQLGAAVAA